MLNSNPANVASSLNPFAALSILTRYTVDAPLPAITEILTSVFPTGIFIPVEKVPDATSSLSTYTRAVGSVVNGLNCIGVTKL